jgi:hypothetical protein
MVLRTDVLLRMTWRVPFDLPATGSAYVRGVVGLSHAAFANATEMVLRAPRTPAVMMMVHFRIADPPLAGATATDGDAGTERATGAGSP